MYICIEWAFCWEYNGNIMGLLRDMHVYIYIWLMVLTILKNMKVNGKDYPIYYGK
jgi:hypothetical protein